VNKHLLPVGDWPMIYYPLQLLQLAGVREVMIVTGQGTRASSSTCSATGGCARAARRAAVRSRPHLQGAGRGRRIAQVVGMAESFAGSDKLVVCLGTTSSSTRRRRDPRVRGAEDGAAVFVKEVPDPEAFGVVVYGDDGRVTDVVEKAGVVDLRYPTPPSHDAVVGLYCYSPDVFDVIAAASRRRAASSRSPTSTGTTPSAARSLPPRHRLVGGRRDAGVARPDRRADRRDGRRTSGTVIDGLLGCRCSASRTSAAGSASSAARAAAEADRQTNVSFSRRA
jgi:glucose-1-phosphate thymidylyltransferase